MLWTGRIVSGIAALFMLAEGVSKLFKPAPVIEGVGRLGYPESVIIGLGIVLTICALLYAIPRTSVLGAILLTGYLGGATSAHVRIGDSLFAILFPGIVGVLIWGGLFLRDERLRSLIPFRK